jgi:uncharacterized secreted protein with C-terminal beta-propeller domain
MRRFASAAALYLGVLAIAAVVAGIVRPDGAGSPVVPQATTGLQPGDIELVAALEPFAGCDDLLAYFKREGLERVGPYGLGGAPYLNYAVDTMAGGAESAAAGAPADGSVRVASGSTTADQQASGKDSFSGTNVQEEGVDEPDTVKTDGNIVVTLAGERLQILGVEGTTLRRLSALRIPNAWGNEILLDGDRILVLGHGQAEVMPMDAMGDTRGMIAPEMAAPISTLRLIDISDPADPQVVSTLTLDGDYVSARLADGVARVVLRSQPAALPFVMPEGGGLRAERRATDHNREVIENSTIDEWLPYAVISDESQGIETESTLLDCDAVHHPETFSGFGMVSVLTVDLGDDLQADGSAGVVGSAETVYASPDNLYVALNDWGMDWSTDRAPDRPRAPATDIHQFDISDASAASYVASGRVRGRLLNQWAMSEHAGHLRVATTIDSVDGTERSESAVVILRATDGALEPQGRVGGLGKGEQIYAVRYDGDIGYVVTFRQTDPLYTLDLSNPARPKAMGALKVNGYSAYLHPVAEGRVLGIGQDAKDDGQIIGAQASLFDVSDLNDPRRIDQVDLGSGQSTVEYDHRAFLYWQPTGTAVLPLQSWENKPFMGVVVLRTDGDSVRRVGRISHANATPAGDSAGGKSSDDAYYGYEGPMITRSLVIDDALLTVSDAGILISDLDSLDRRDWVAFRR